MICVLNGTYKILQITTLVYNELPKRLYRLFILNLFFVFICDVSSTFSGGRFHTDGLKMSPVKCRQNIAGKKEE